jgi:hypothetical protein
MIYYVYENWTAGNKAVIHKGLCGNYKEGKGCHKNPLKNKNGKWSPPFKSMEEAERFARETGRPVHKYRSRRCIKSLILTLCAMLYAPCVS